MAGDLYQLGLASATMAAVCSHKCPLALNAEATLTPPSVCNAKIKAEAALSKYFGFNSFRSGQLSAIMPALHGKDVFVRMGTGSGKTLCMFMVPLATSNVATSLIISPLIGLMEQQV